MQVTLQNSINKHTLPVRSFSFNRANITYAYKPLAFDTVSFTGKKDFLDKPVKEIFNIVSDVVKDSKNRLGYGGEADVFNIPDTNYCVRLFRLTDTGDVSEKYLDFTESFSKDISNKDKINHIVAKLGNGTTIMQKLNGTPIITPEMDFKEHTKIINTIRDFPVSAYNKFLKQISNAYYNGMEYDAHPSNVIVNLKDKTFTAIDFQQNEGKVNIAPLFEMFLTFGYFSTEFVQMSPIVNKILRSALEELKPNVKPCLPLDKFDFSEFLESLMYQPQLDIDISIPHLLSLDSDFARLIYLKMKELQGDNLTHELKDLHKKLTDKIDDIFYITDGF